jgi:hypothetical protein
VGRIDHTRGEQEGVAENAGSKRRGKLKRIAQRSVIRLSTRLRCARIGLSLMDNFAAMAINASSLMVALR